MNIVMPLKVLSANVVASNVPEDDADEWDSGDAPYGDEDIVMVTTTANGASEATHRVYQSTAGGNNSDPTLRETYDDNGVDVLWWNDLGPTNRFKAFDDFVQRQTENAGSIEYTLEMDDLFDSLVFLGVDANAIEITVTDPVEGVVFEATIDLLLDDNVGDWWEYFNAPIEYDEKAVRVSVPGFTGAQLNVKFLFPESTAKVGVFVVGSGMNIGRTQYGLELSIQDFSTKGTSSDSGPVNQGTFIDEQRALVKVETGRFDQVKRLLTSRRALPTVYFADADFPGTIIYGYFMDFRLIIPGPRISECLLEVEGIEDV